MPRSSAKPICQACNRPFDPRSPGATARLGPTCARRAGLGSDPEAQLAFAFAPGATPSEAPRIPAALFRAPRPRLPARVRARYDLAKLAFDELFREFCLTGVLLSGARAQAAEREIWDHAPAAFPLSDPSLPWLEPEHDLTLLIDGERVFHRRVINDVVTLLEIPRPRDIKARRHVDVIIAFVSEVRALAVAEEAVQLSLL